MGLDSSDDAAIFQLSDDLCIVQTLDFFPPVVDNPYDYGAIAAANSLSDVYAMGGDPLLALNIVCFPEDLPKSILHEILRGASDTANKAGVIIAGGHTVKDAEPKFGLSVTGIIHPSRIYRNNTAKNNDCLILTKPLGTGIITTAAKAQLASQEALSTAIEVMRELNSNACKVIQKIPPNSVTDVTGFGLIGHLTEMMRGSNTTAQISFDKIPLLPQCLDLAREGIYPGGTLKNMQFSNQTTLWEPGIDEAQKLLLCDAQTSGGLLISIPPNKADSLVASLAKTNVDAAIIGRVKSAYENSTRVIVSE